VLYRHYREPSMLCGLFLGIKGCSSRSSLYELLKCDSL